jgi:haloacetate dehalogenase
MRACATLRPALKLLGGWIFLWGRHGFPARTGDPAGIWRRWADTVTDECCDSGHFVMEEAPSEVVDSFLPFFVG